MEFREDQMARKRRKSVSFDAMVKYFLQNYNIPTKKDINKLMVRLDNLEQMIIKASADPGKSRRISRSKSGMTASDTVLDVMKRFKQGVKFAEIQNRTGFEEKKLRNVIFRLNKMGKIARKRRGEYILS
jgi:hypothetical protein